MHIARFASDKGLIDFNFAAEFAAMLPLLGKPDTMEHEPCGFLSHSKRFRNFATANAILAVKDQPHCRKPLVQTERRVLEDSSNLHRELSPRVAFAALPAQLILQEADTRTAAPWTGNAVLPLGATGDEIVQAVLLIREVQDRFLQGLWFVCAFHASIVRWNRVLVNYIIALI
jgi:hypothetical protein